MCHAKHSGVPLLARVPGVADPCSKLLLGRMIFFKRLVEYTAYVRSEKLKILDNAICRKGSRARKLLLASSDIRYKILAEKSYFNVEKVLHASSSKKFLGKLLVSEDKYTAVF